MKRVAITTLGCKTNQFESATMIEQFVNAGYIMVPFAESADIYVINSCTVTARTDAETRRLIRRARRQNPSARIVATGCYAQVAPGELERLPELDHVIGNQEKQRIISMIESGESHVSDISVNQKAEPLPLTSFSEHTRAFLQAQNGCNSFCSYCIVPFARGRSRSVTPNEVISGIRELVAHGHQEVVLTGIHLGAYGLDLTPQGSLLKLVRMIVELNLVPRLRIGSVEPNELCDELINVMANSTIVCRHLHLPIQSGSDSVLQRMGRAYVADDLKILTEKITTAMPDCFIGGDIIAGFPGESDDEFGETVALLNALPLADLHVFPYSRRPGTRADHMEGHVNPQIIKQRAEELRNLAAGKKQTFLESFVGKQVEVLIQGYSATTGDCNGLSRNYLPVRYPGTADDINHELRITISGSSQSGCTGIRLGTHP